MNEHALEHDEQLEHELGPGLEEALQGAEVGRLGSPAGLAAGADRPGIEESAESQQAVISHSFQSILRPGSFKKVSTIKNPFFVFKGLDRSLSLVSRITGANGR